MIPPASKFVFRKEHALKIDVLRYIGAVTREVQSREHEGRPARVVVATCAYDTTITDVWDAITNAERIPRWFLPISGDLRLGGRYQLHGNASGQVTGCEPPRSLALTWEFGGQVSWVHVQLTELSDGGTRLQLGQIGGSLVVAEHAHARPHSSRGNQHHFLASPSLLRDLFHQLLHLAEVGLLLPVSQHTGTELHHNAGNVFEQFATHSSLVAKGGASVEYAHSWSPSFSLFSQREHNLKVGL